MVPVDAHLMGVIFDSLGLYALASFCFQMRPGLLINVSEREIDLVRDALRRSVLGMQTIEYFLSELTAAEERGR